MRPRLRLSPAVRNIVCGCEELPARNNTKSRQCSHRRFRRVGGPRTTGMHPGARQIAGRVSAPAIPSNGKIPLLMFPSNSKAAMKTTGTRAENGSHRSLRCGQFQAESEFPPPAVLQKESRLPIALSIVAALQLPGKVGRSRFLLAAYRAPATSRTAPERQAKEIRPESGGGQNVCV